MNLMNNVTGATAAAFMLLSSAYGRAPHTITVVAHDYAFAAPDSAAAGEMTFMLENRGTKDHELMVGLLRPGAGAADIVAAHQRGIGFRQLTKAYLDGPVGGILYALPGETAKARLLVNLDHGRTYVLFCQLRDTVGAQPHAAMGMFHLLRVK